MFKFDCSDLRIIVRRVDWWHPDYKPWGPDLLSLFQTMEHEYRSVGIIESEKPFPGQFEDFFKETLLSLPLLEKINDREMEMEFSHHVYEDRIEIIIHISGTNEVDENDLDSIALNNGVKIALKILGVKM